MNFPASLGALVAVAMAAGTFSITAAEAYTLAEAALPAETPPASYSDDIYVDSRGCIYVRASIGATVNWVPRLSRDRETVVCNMAPSAGSAGTAVAGADPAPVTPAPTRLPEATVAAAAVTVPAPAPVAAPVAARVPEPDSVGPATRVAPAGAAEVSRSMDVTCPGDGAVVRVQIGGDTVAVSCPRGMTRVTSYVVTHADGSRSRLVAHPASAVVRTGDTVASGAPTATHVVGSTPGAVTVVHSVPVTTAPPIHVPAGYQPAWDDDRLNPDRGPRTAYGDAEMARVLDTSKVPMPAAETAAVRSVVGSKSQPGAADPAPGARWVQVGAFGVSANATRAIGTLQGLGYTAATSRTGSGLTLVMAGPFASTAELKRALQTLRGIYPDAYTRG